MSERTTPPYIQVFHPGDPTLATMAKVLGSPAGQSPGITSVVLDLEDFIGALREAPPDVLEHAARLSMLTIYYAPDRDSLFKRFGARPDYLLCLKARSSQLDDVHFAAYTHGELPAELQKAQEIYLGLSESARKHVDQAVEAIQTGMDLQQILDKFSNDLPKVVGTGQINAIWRQYMKTVRRSAEVTMAGNQTGLPQPERNKFLTGYFQRLLGITTYLFIQHHATKFRELQP